MGEREAAAASSPVWGYASGKAAAALAKAAAVAMAERSKASIKRALHKTETQEDPDGFCSQYGEVVRRQFHDYAKFCRVAAAAMYEHNHDYYGGYCVFWEVPAVGGSLGHWCCLQLAMGERRNTNADDWAGVNAAEPARRPARLRGIHPDICVEHHDRGLLSPPPLAKHQTPTTEGTLPKSAPPSAPRLNLTPRSEAKAAGLRFTPREGAVPKEEGIRLSEGQAPAEGLRRLTPRGKEAASAEGLSPKPMARSSAAASSE
jgi:hypothetical protein